MKLIIIYFFKLFNLILKDNYYINQMKLNYEIKNLSNKLNSFN